MIQRRFIPITAIAAVIIFLFYYHSTSIEATWRRIPQHIGLGDKFDEVLDPDRGQQHDPTEDLKNWNPKMDFRPGESRPMGYNFSTLLVMATTKEEDTNWVQELIPNQPIAKYVANDPSAKYHPPKNKGHEVMIYLSWIIDNYHDLPDVTLFMHWHRWTWHNNEIMGLDSSEIVKRLNPNRVIREGFMNLRCHWHPGCPDWMKPGATDDDEHRPEQRELAKAWSELFPLDPIPQVLAGMCCAQFALSADRIRALPLSRYVYYRDWLLRTRLEDGISGRVWEYVWHFIWTGETFHCPEEHVCYCDGYGFCFGGRDQYNEYQEINGKKRGWEGKLRDWRNKKEAIEKAEKEGKTEELKKLEKPEPGKDAEFEKEIQKYNKILDGLRDNAVKRGNDPKTRAEELGREWKEGDGF
ncbi:hypothetical protein EJ05DRAFT_477652 [Pseudovirgaria hyperparasitica]|uniref:DUF3431 domain-containing protein n=1 Tax=Pseudovirgaria hyperparasitica TaxID=470096 RepID=A0A6A6W0T6_9PEZI|nr:uncharacterized protein EJ05DRAFT_477652 [Pseudovirgaria hyperparasitica]KAF2756528.1 hypothetical protein EJ05DRAFT_477652 [Pseudovirgaria hyperparasitica]